ncbi:MAG: nucleotidyltransferase domain-containing protein [Bacteroidales bacterium]|nr:nucleotidyltransferase domain-containing protein [Bacteroidales bacterium]
MDKANAVRIGSEFILLLKRKEFSIRAAYLYGSFAKGNYHQDSDIDIAIFLETLSDPIQAQIEMLKLTWNFNTRIEPHPFHEEELLHSNPLIEEILKTGIPLNIQ